MAENRTWQTVQLPENAELLRKELFDYSTETGRYQIELFETTTGTFYAIATPKDSDRLIVFGSPVVDDRFTALQTVIEKITRDCF